MKSKTRKLSTAAAANNVATQLAMNPQTIAQLRKFGVTPKTKKKLQFSFSVTSTEDAFALHDELASLGYGKLEAFKEGRKIAVQGWTKKMLVVRPKIDAWVRAMCKLGFEHGALFEGWGTSQDA